MDYHLVVAIIAALINIILSLILPALLKNSKLPFSAEIRQNYQCNREVILVSSILVVIFVFISLKITPWVQSNVFNNLAKLGAN
tara:strand:+ start:672 stop:923 length:252 start_codon:yes stop_codon:yes gene_type:complete